MNKRTNVGRLLAGIVSCVLALGLVVGLAGCGKNDEELIRESVSTTMDLFKNPSEEKLKPWVEESGVDLSSLDEYGIDFYEFVGHLFAHFDYTINDVKVDGDKATASLTLTNADVTSVIEQATADITGNIDQYTDMLTAEDGQEQFMKVYFDKIYEILDSTDKTVTTDADLTLTKKDGQWEVDDSSKEQVVSAMFGGINL